jgi:cobalt/nickel transport system ATP-binding protein
MSKFLIEARNITYEYGDGTKALKDVSLGIEAGKKLAVIGANGAGKSTLFLHFNGINRPKSGEVLFRDKPIGYSQRDLLGLRKEVGIVFQEPDHQLFSSSVYQEISFGPVNLKLSKEEIKKRVEQAMEATAVTELQHKPTHFLSYGQKKRVAIASILAMEPSLLILDEPTSGLDPQNVDAVMSILNSLSKEGKTILLSTHDIDLAYSWADYIFIMNRGQVAGQGYPEEVFLDEALLKEASLKQPWMVELCLGLKRGRLAEGEKMPRSKWAFMEYVGRMAKDREL